VPVPWNSISVVKMMLRVLQVESPKELKKLDSANR